MNFFIKRGWALLLAALCLSGCGEFGVDGNTGSNCTSAETCRQVTIGGVTWMAENLNIKTGNSWCYGDSASYCRKYGRLYDWETAMTACPAGWHLPSSAEWDALVEYAGDGCKLKSTSGWGSCAANGTDDYGFSALSGGYRFWGGSFSDGGAGGWGYWWTASEIDGWKICAGDDCAYVRAMESSYLRSSVVFEYQHDKKNGLSVRCVAD
jgi:uncharacterized protein (TIGR02145 family)